MMLRRKEKNVRHDNHQSKLTLGRSSGLIISPSSLITSFFYIFSVVRSAHHPDYDDFSSSPHLNWDKTVLKQTASCLWIKFLLLCFLFHVLVVFWFSLVSCPPDVDDLPKPHHQQNIHDEKMSLLISLPLLPLYVLTTLKILKASLSFFSFSRLEPAWFSLNHHHLHVVCCWLKIWNGMDACEYSWEKREEITIRCSNITWHQQIISINITVMSFINHNTPECW